ncbi:MAG TPA: 23S rRNA pseudouridine(1911/1915/1917) synthase RluD [Burkholderiales bacterium]|nr:23S rRNA pseudouridine(1911/1915/1917) synthase RluD [Burkholderiales bacterium]
MSSPQIKMLNIPDKFIGQRLDSTLVAIIPELSRNRLTNWIKNGSILVDNHLSKANYKVLGGELITIKIPTSDDVLAFTPENISLNIVYKDNDIIVINKPANFTVHPGAGNWHGTLLNALLYHFKELALIPRAGIVHRLDKDTTGLMVIARTLQSQANLVKQLQNRTVIRIYHAIVEGKLNKEGVINKNIGRNNKNRTKMTTLEFGGKEAITHYKVLEYFKQFSYIECQLKTGRTHQIRVHLKSINHPIVGDPLYSTKKNHYSKPIIEAIKELNRQALHATKLSLIHPTTNKEMSWEIPLAKDIQNLLTQLEKTSNY